VIFLYTTLAFIFGGIIGGILVGRRMVIDLITLDEAKDIAELALFKANDQLRRLGAKDGE
tara:strand:- start:60 stop:239 length:180 start_codon:yes stop_codon:yes gene_type:complete